MFESESVRIVVTETRLFGCCVGGGRKARGRKPTLPSASGGETEANTGNMATLGPVRSLTMESTNQGVLASARPPRQSPSRLEKAWNSASARDDRCRRDPPTKRRFRARFGESSPRLQESWPCRTTPCDRLRTRQSDWKSPSRSTPRAGALFSARGCDRAPDAMRRRAHDAGSVSRASHHGPGSSGADPSRR